MSLITPQMRQAARVVHADAEPFATIQSGVTDYPLTIHGKRLRRLLNFESLYRTDWQGRVRLSSESRTNIFQHSIDLSGLHPTHDFVHVTPTTEPGPNGRGSWVEISTDGSPNGYQSEFNYGLSTDVVGQQICAGMFFRRSGARYVKLNGYGNGTWGIVCDLQTGAASVNDNWHSAECILIDGDLALFYGTLTAFSTSTFIVGFTGSNGDTFPVSPVSVKVWGGFVIPNASSPGAYIANTTDAPVTINDFSRTTDTVSLSDISGGGVLDWTGDARVIG